MVERCLHLAEATVERTGANSGCGTQTGSFGWVSEKLWATPRDPLVGARNHKQDSSHILRPHSLQQRRGWLFVQVQAQERSLHENAH